MLLSISVSKLGGASLICEKCGHANPDVAEFCSYCGYTMLTKAGSPASAMEPPQKHSEVGIASIISSVLGGMLALISVVGAVILTAQGKVQSDPIMALCGCGILLSFPIFIVGGILGIVGLFNPNRKKITAIIGLILNILPCLLLITLMLIGLVFKDRM